MAQPKHAKATPKETSTKGEIGEFVDLTKRYVLQETLGPLKSIGRTLAFGSAGAIMFGFASVLALVGVLRVLETETGTRFAGNLTWLPYLITIGAGLLILLLAALILLRSPKTAGRPPSETQ
ncbi:MAG TPA: hypothetical protein VGP46_05100 [Acidimicrobiales bacterium]|jgi:hypothetical protein|nr:hypothetical protein [Acidimicrobiales bacterium]